MKVTHLCDGQAATVIEERDLPGDQVDARRWLSDSIAVQSMRVREVNSTLEQPLHPAPRRQIGVVLRGRLEVESLSGDRRTFGPGSIIFLEDVNGSGHITRIIEAPATYIEIHLAPENPV